MYGKNANGHIWWNVCTCEQCPTEDKEPIVETKKIKKKSLQQILKERYEARDPRVGLPKKPYDKFDYYVLYYGKEEEKDSSPSKSWNPKTS